jgi:hypothetical protein
VPAYAKGELSLDAYLVRILAALCKQSGGELRIKGELVDAAGEATTLLKSWDSTKQEVVLTVSMGTFSEVFRVVAEKQPAKTVITAAQTPERTEETPAPTRVGSTLLNEERLTHLESILQKRRIASMLNAELKQRRQAPQGETP